MGKINILGFDVANLIAAGEVVDRPSSVVKELLENSIDAGASTVTVEIQRGGVAFIRISDNGCGMEPEDLPVAILRPDVTILAIDSTAKRIGYVSETAELLGLKNVTAIAMRAEDGGKNSEYRERFDIVTARAVAEMRVLSELCLPYAKVGGQFIAMKGKNAEFELQGAKKAISMLGGRDVKVEEISLKGAGETLTHPLIIINKKERTPQNYPRPFAQISKKPL